MIHNYKISVYDFVFKFVGYGHYHVTYFNPKTRERWSKVITDMTIIDRTKNAAYPKIKDLNSLKRMVKSTN